MDADAADRPGAGEHSTPVGPDDRLRTAVLAAVGLAALVGGGWWWQAEAPRTGLVADSSGGSPAVQPEARVRAVVPAERSGQSVNFWLVDPGSGVAFRTDPRSGVTVRVDPGTGAVVQVDPRGGAAARVGAGDPETRRAGSGRRQDSGGRRALDSFPDTVWSVQGLLRPTGGIVKQASAERGARHLLQYRCVGPGELLIVVDGAWAADPITSACDGSVTATEVTGRGGPFQVSLSSANAEPLRVEAQLVALG
ncbi:hypothetical protein ACGFIR_16715 [Micromonospora sp. NPDC049051]|uniref:hypothetical protein n=1 Tax=Micromonospora sp. NPDC049051 TaxID=3364264 RepID=UPI003723D74E